MNKSNFVHVGFALLFQAAIGLLTGNWWAGAAFGSGFFISREHTQKQYKRQRETGESLKEMKPWGGLDFWNWDTDALLDAFLCIPFVVVVAVYLTQS